jgi:hypothetical protein
MDCDTLGQTIKKRSTNLHLSVEPLVSLWICVWKTHRFLMVGLGRKKIVPLRDRLWEEILKK